MFLGMSAWRKRRCRLLRGGDDLEEAAFEKFWTIILQMCGRNYQSL